MKVLIAPDKFKDALDAARVAAAIAAGVRISRPGAMIDECPMADGGEGTGPILAAALGAVPACTTAASPRMQPRTAVWWHARETSTGIVEMAAASGLGLLKADERDPLRTTSYGTGQLVQAGVAAGCTRVLLGVGGSATVDGGAGCLQALGWTFEDPRGRLIAPGIGGGMLAQIARIHPPTARPEVELEVLCDVDNPLLGERGAAPVFGSQKGASPQAVRALEAGLVHWADVLEVAMGRDVRTRPHGGAAGGIAAGLAAALNAKLRPGIDAVAQHVQFCDRLQGCNLCVTGEGRMDDQTVGGKVVAGVARMAREAGVPTIALVGAVQLHAGQTLADLAAALGLARIIVITPPGMPETAALAATGENLRRAAREFI